MAPDKTSLHAPSAVCARSLVLLPDRRDIL